MLNKYYIVNLIGDEYYDNLDEIIGAFENIETARNATDDFLKNFNDRPNEVVEMIYIFENRKRIKGLGRTLEYEPDIDAYRCIYEWEQD